MIKPMTLSSPTAAAVHPERAARAAPVRLWGADILLGAVLVLLAGTIRWLGMNRSLWIDEMSSLGFAYNGVRGVISAIIAFDRSPPLYYLTVHVAYFKLGLSAVGALRWPSILAGAASVVIVFALARILAGRTAAIVAGALAMLLPLPVWYSDEGRMYAMTWMFVLLSFLFLAISVQSERRIWLVGYATAIGLALYADETAAIALVPQAILVAWAILRRQQPQRRWRHIGLAYVGGWIIFVLWLTVLPRQFAILHGQTFAGYPPALGTALKLALDQLGLTASYAFHNSFLVPGALAAAMLVAYAAALVTVLRLGPEYFLFKSIVLCLVLGPPVMAAAFVVEGSYGVLIPRVTGIESFGLALMVGGAAGHLMRAIPTRTASALVGGALVAVLVGGSALSLLVVETKGSNGEMWPPIAATIAHEAQPGDALIYYPYGVKYIIDAYLPADSSWKRDGTGAWSEPDPAAQTQFLAWMRGHPRTWLVFYAAGGIHMTIQDRMLQAAGYRLVMGNPAAKMGLLAYVAPP